MKVHFSQDAYTAFESLPPNKKQLAERLIREIESAPFNLLAEGHPANQRLQVGKVKMKGGGNFFSIRLPNSVMRVIAEKREQSAKADELQIVDLFSHAY